MLPWGNLVRIGLSVCLQHRGCVRQRHIGCCGVMQAEQALAGAGAQQVGKSTARFGPQNLPCLWNYPCGPSRSLCIAFASWVGDKGTSPRLVCLQGQLEVKLPCSPLQEPSLPKLESEEDMSSGGGSRCRNPCAPQIVWCYSHDWGTENPQHASGVRSLPRVCWSSQPVWWELVACQLGLHWQLHATCFDTSKLSIKNELDTCLEMCFCSHNSNKQSIFKK